MVAGIHVWIHFPWLLAIMKTFPEKFVEWLDPSLGSVFAFQKVESNSLIRLYRVILYPADTSKDIRLQAKAIIEANNDDRKDEAHPTIFRELVHSDLPPEEKTLERLQHEGQILVAAGGDTVKTTTYVAICHVLLNRMILANLKEELLTAWPDLDGPQPSLPSLEKLPYLTAVIQEGK